MLFVVVLVFTNAKSEDISKPHKFGIEAYRLIFLYAKKERKGKQQKKRLVVTSPCFYVGLSSDQSERKQTKRSLSLSYRYSRLKDDVTII